MTLYLCGPITGLPEFNYPAFHAAAKKLRAYGAIVLNPAENAGSPSKTWEQYMRDAIAMLVCADALAVLPGWESSRGAMIEVQLARELAMPIHFLP